MQAVLGWIFGISVILYLIYRAVCWVFTQIYEGLVSLQSLIPYADKLEFKNFLILLISLLLSPVIFFVVKAVASPRRSVGELSIAQQGSDFYNLDEDDKIYGDYVYETDGTMVHRNIAVTVLRRRLRASEVVHHINGDRYDNRVSNLCVMSRDKHEHFHAWLKWKKEKYGYYPPQSIQRKALASEYEGVLLA